MVHVSWLFTGCPRGEERPRSVVIVVVYRSIDCLKALNGISRLLRKFEPAIVPSLGGLDVSRTSGIVPC